MTVMPGPNLLQPRLVQLHNVEDKVVSDTPLVEPDLSSQTSDLHQLHVVYQGAAVLPRGLGVTVKSLETDLLRSIKTAEGCSKHLDCVMDEGCLSLKIKLSVFISLYDILNTATTKIKLSTLTFMNGTGFDDTLDGNLFSPRIHDLTTLITSGL